MKQRLKGLLALVLSLVMVFALATNAWAMVWIGSTSMGDGTTTTYYYNGTNGAQGSTSDTDTGNWNAKVERINGVQTLTLNNFAYNGSDGITATENLTIDLIGNNTVTYSGSSGNASVSVNGNLTITSSDPSAKLTADFNTNSGNANGGGIEATNVTISGGTVKATGKTHGIFAYNDGHSGGMKVTINGGSVEAYATDDSDGIGIYAPGGEIAISGDNTQVTVGCATGLEASVVNILENSTVKINAALTAIDSTTLNMGSDPWYQWSTNNPGETTPVSSATKAFALNNYGGTGQNPVPTSLIIEKISTGAPGNTNPYPPIIYNPTPTPEPEGDKVTAPKTFDGGIASAVVVTILSATGGAWLAKKKD